MKPNEKSIMTSLINPGHLIVLLFVVQMNKIDLELSGT